VQGRQDANGSLEKPMDDGALEAKFHSLADAVIGKPKAELLVQACWTLGAASDVNAIVDNARP